MKLTDENKREVMDMAAKGLSKSEIARRLKVSRHTVSKLLIGAEIKQEENIDTIVEKEEKIARDIAIKLGNEYYGNVMQRIYAAHGISLRNGQWDKLSDYVGKYGVEPLSETLPLAMKLKKAGISPKSLDPNDLEMLSELSKALRNISRENLPYFKVFLHFIKMQDVQKTLDKVVEEGVPRPDALLLLLEKVVNDWQYKEKYGVQLSEATDNAMKSIREVGAEYVGRLASEIELKTMERDKLEMEIERLQERLKRIGGNDEKTVTRLVGIKRAGEL